MDMEIDQPQSFYDFNEADGFDFHFEPDYNAPVDPYPMKQEAYSTDDGTFSSPSASPLPVLPADTLGFSTLPIDLSSHSEDVIFDEAAPIEAAADSANAEDSLNSFGQDQSYADSRDSDSEGHSKRGRKRKAPSSPQSSAGERKKMRFEPGHVIPKDELHKLSADELEEYAQHIQDSNMSTAEKNEIRKHLRLVKNRESAQASRLRKKNYIDDLERRVSMLQSENSNLRSNINTLHNENTQLKSEVVYLKGVVNNGGLSKVLSQGASFFSKLSQQQQQQQQSGKTAPSINPRTAGVVLMVVLFSVGLMFNTPVGQQPLPFKSYLLLSEPRPQRCLTYFHSVPTDQKQGRILNHANYKPTSEVRDVLSVLEQSDMPTQRIRQLVEKQRVMPDSSSHKVLEDSSKVSRSVVDSVEPKPVINDWKANTTYLLCPDVQKLAVPAEITQATDASLPLQISFLIPSTALDAGAGEDAPRAGRSSNLLEVTCQVLDVVSRSYSKPSDIAV